MFIDTGDEKSRIKKIEQTKRNATNIYLYYNMTTYYLEN